ncbi:MAG TPA: class I SAM-dependent rRNA methyltransferase [Candidatus Eisenbacteria bacterium]|jgi:23S rRNA (cytosine1962-C5)-methyltransferase|nr:class I SAM-dependent rRNA methyltransferase [Candidatus Eisenbacteria bacterium]
MKIGPSVQLKAGPQGATRFGHPWIYKNQVKDVAGAPEPGQLVRVLGERGIVGLGYYNPRSEIAVRLLCRGAAESGATVDAAFFRERIERAAAFRRRNVSETNAWRLVSSEADGLPGLIVDRYGEVLVVQFLTQGMERLKDAVIAALEEASPSRGIFERSDSGSRRLEGLEDRVGWIRRDCGDSVEIVEGEIRCEVRFGEGHKTGFYLDQRENRLLFGQLAKQEAAAQAPRTPEALDAFCYEGGFSLHLAAAGFNVLGIDIQPEVLARAEENRRLNGLDARIEFRAADVFDELKALEKGGRRFDFVVLDPPSFVKKKSAVEGALAGYKEILLRGMRLLRENGRLAVFSCSYHVDENLLMQSAMAAAYDVRRSLRVLKFLKQSADHPINPFIPETYYLKGFLFEVSTGF